MADLSEILTINEVATQLEVSTRTIRERIKDEKLKAHKAFGKWYVFREDLLDAIRNDRL